MAAVERNPSERNTTARRLHFSHRDVGGRRAIPNRRVRQHRGALQCTLQATEVALPGFALAMLGYHTKRQRVPIEGVDDLVVRSLLDKQQFFDPDGAAAALGISSASWSLFGQIWPSGLELADRLARRPVRSGERILEIGCGLALASMVGHRRGADVTASDIHPLAGPFLRRNLRLNGLEPMSYCHGPWAEPPYGTVPLEPRCAAMAYDLLIGSDLLYEPDPTGQLASFVARHAAPGAELWIVDPDRGNRTAFHARMRALGYSRTEERCGAAASATRVAFKGRLIVYRQVESAHGVPETA